MGPIQGRTKKALLRGVELRGLEPLTPTLPVWCATSCATAPYRSTPYRPAASAAGTFPRAAAAGVRDLVPGECPDPTQPPAAQLGPRNESSRQAVPLQHPALGA